MNKKEETRGVLTFWNMLSYDSIPFCWSAIAGNLGSGEEENARNPSHPPAHVSRIARMLVEWDFCTVYIIHITLGAGTVMEVSFPSGTPK